MRQYRTEAKWVITKHTKTDTDIFFQKKRYQKWFWDNGDNCNLSAKKDSIWKSFTEIDSDAIGKTINTSKCIKRCTGTVIFGFLKERVPRCGGGL